MVRSWRSAFSPHSRVLARTPKVRRKWMQPLSKRSATAVILTGSLCPRGEVLLQLVHPYPNENILRNHFVYRSFIVVHSGAGACPDKCRDWNSSYNFAVQ